MSVKHKWHKEIKAWADGAKIEFKDEADLDEWLDTDAPFWEDCDGIEYRIKPQPQEQDKLVRKAVKDALEKAATICERDYIRFKQTEEAHYRQSPQRFNPIDFGFNMNDVNRAFHTALEIRALIEKD